MLVNLRKKLPRPRSHDTKAGGLGGAGGDDADSGLVALDGSLRDGAEVAGDLSVGVVADLREKALEGRDVLALGADGKRADNGRSANRREFGGRCRTCRSFHRGSGDADSRGRLLGDELCEEGLELLDLGEE